MIEDNTRRRENPAPKNQRLTAIRSGGVQHKTCSSDFSRRRPTSITPSPRLEAGNGIPHPPRRGPGEQRRPPRRRGTIDASMAQSRQLRRRSRRLGPQVEPPIRDLPREALLALTRKWAVATGDYRRHAPSRSGRDAVDLPVAVGNRSPEAVCRFARGVDDLCPHWAQNRRKNDAKRGRLGAKTGPKVCKTDPRADKYGRVLAMESHAAETFVNQSFRASPEGSAARQLTFGDCVQGGQRADCQLTVSSFLGVLVWRQGTEKAVPHRDRVAAAIQQGEAARRAGGHAPGAAGLLHPGTHFYKARAVT